MNRDVQLARTPEKGENDPSRRNTQTADAETLRADPGRDAPQLRRRNPRIVIGNLDFFDLLFEQSEQL